MQAIRVVLLVLVGLAALVAARPTVFLGGNFQSLAGTGVWGVSGASQLAAYHRATGQWSTKPQGAYASGTATPVLINDIAAAGNGVFAVGNFESVTVTGTESTGVAFWDGQKWCSIRESIAGVGNAVHCDTATSCWVTGAFTDINNLPLGVGVTVNFAHYNFDTTTNEWEFDQEITSWNSALGGITPLPFVPEVDRLYAVGSFFFVSDSTNNIYKGGAADDGWHLFANAASIDTVPAPIVDWTVEGSAVYVITEAPTDNSAGKASAVITGNKVTTGCAPCSATVPADWNVLVGNTNASIFQGYSKIAVTGTTQYLVTLHDLDAEELDWNPKYRVVEHSGTGGATLNLVGEPFELDSSDPVKQMWIDENGNVVVVGPHYGNLFYPPNTDDNSGALADRRITDRFTQIAVYNGSRWVQAFGGGFEIDDTLDFPSQLRHAYNSETGEFFFVGPFEGTYDVHAEGAAYFDDNSNLATPFFPLFSRAITRRGSFPALSSVYDIVCDTSTCSNVFVGGDFAHHGPDTFGAIAAVAVDQSGTPEVTIVGGGLWFVDTMPIDQDNLQTTAGEVYALARWGNHLYAGGSFRHGSRPTNPDYVCLHNIARINVNQENAVWEDLHAGCEGNVFDIVFWNDLLIAGGDFIQCGGGRVVNHVASYSVQSGANAQWASLHNGVDDIVYSLEIFQGRLIAGGGFTHAGGLPVTGVASWDGWKWRALVPACSDDCVAGGLDFYYTNLQTPESVYDLRTDLSGDSLWARVVIASGPTVLGKWQYTSGDLGQWTVAGDGVTLDKHNVYVGHTIANFGQDNIILAAPVGPLPWRAVDGDVGLYHSGLDNWVADQRSVVDSNVYVIRGPQASSASALASPLSVLLSFF